MNVLHLPHGYWPATGGAEYLARGWSEGLAARGHAVHVCVADLATPEGLYRFGTPTTGRSNEVHNAVSIQRVGLDPAYRLGSTIFRRDPYAPGRTGDRIRRRVHRRLRENLEREIERLQPDVVLTLPHLFENVRVVFDLHRDMAFPLIWAPMLHESDPNWPFDDVAQLVGTVDGLIAMTPSEADRLVSRYGADADRVHVVSPGVSTPVAPPDMVANRPTVLYLGRISRSKGLDILPAAMAAVWARRPETRLIIAGAATPDLPEIQAAFDDTRTSDLGGIVEFHLDVTDDDKVQLLRAATALVLPSERESFGIVLLEAWAAATPVVAVDSPVFCDTVRHDIDGLLVPTRDSDSFAAALLALVEDPARSRDMGLAGFTRARNEYAWDGISARLEQVYESVIARQLQHPS